MTPLKTAVVSHDFVTAAVVDECDGPRSKSSAILAWWASPLGQGVGRDSTEGMKGLMDQITIDPAVRSDKPCIRETRTTVHDLLEYLAGGMTSDDTLREFPELTSEDIQAVLQFAAARERRLAHTAKRVIARHILLESDITEQLCLNFFVTAHKSPPKAGFRDSTREGHLREGTQPRMQPYDYSRTALASSSRMNRSSEFPTFLTAYDVGHIFPSSSFASSVNPSVANRASAFSAD